MSRGLVIASLCAVVYGSGIIGPVTNLHIVNKFISPDGFSRSAVLAGGTAHSAHFPGPVIAGMKGDRFRINIINSLTDTTMLRGTSVHWHGIFHRNSSWADGPVGVTQCPIISGDSFLYDFIVHEQAGTFWYHSHYSTQYCDGLRGALVVYDPDDPHKLRYDIDDASTIITLADWFHTPAHAAQKALRIPIAESILINGKGRYAGGETVPLSVINVVPMIRYRFRLVSLSCDSNLMFSIDSHKMTIIEVDGGNVEPVTVDSIQIFSGQRYSFVLTPNQPIGNYWIRAMPNLAASPTFNGGLNSAILRYAGAADEEPAHNAGPTSTQPLVETDLHPLDNPGAPGGSGPADISINLDIGLDSSSVRKFTINGATYTSPSVPVLLQIMSGAQKAQDLLPADSVYTLPPNKVVEVSFTGTAAGFVHPLHLHGHSFNVVRSAGNSSYNYVNPVRRDVVNTGNLTTDGDKVTIRFTTDSAGPWILHCHINWHLELGFAVVFAEDTPTLKNSYRPASWDDLCPDFNSQPPEFID